MDFLYLWREMLAQKTRVLLTIFAISWGTIAICLMLAAGQGLLSTMTKLMDELGAHLIVVKGLTTSMPYQGQSAGQQIFLDHADILNLREMPGVASVSPEYNTVTKITYGSKARSFQAVSGVEPAYRVIRKITLAHGRFINPVDQKNANNVIVLGSLVSKALFSKNENPVGQLIHLGPNLLRVIGVAEDKAQLSQYEAPDNYLTWMPASTYQRFFKGDKIAYIIIKIADGYQRAEITREVKLALALKHEFNPADKAALWIFDNENYIQKMTLFLDGIQWFLGIVGALTLLIASIGIANVMFVAVESATGEIGIKLACGALKRDIIAHYLFEALLVTAIGGAIGVLFSYAVILIANPFLEQVKIIMFKGLHLSLPLFQLAGVICVLGFIGMIAGVFPAMRAAKIQIVEALRHE